GYTASAGSTPNMATAGLASLFLVFDSYHGKTSYRADNPRAFTTGDAAAVLTSIQRGMDWLGKRSGNVIDGYYLYGIERTGVASGRKYIGGKDWFRDGALGVLGAQRPNGAIPVGRYGGGDINTCLNTLFLVYGGAPVAFNKLQYGQGHDWNLNPRDLANLSKYLWSAYERPLNWQSVSIKAKATEIEAPVLFISGSKAAKFSEEEMLKLREYILRGGTILAEPSDGAKPFAKSMEALLAQLFSPADYPKCKLRPLPADHGIYTVIKRQWGKRPKLRAAGDGTRTFFILSDEYLSGDLQMNRTDSDAFKLAMNLLFYATDMGELAGKFASILPDSPPARQRRKVVTVARVKYDAGADYPMDWDMARMAWPALAPYVKHVTGCELKEAAPVRLAADKLDGVNVLHITGRLALALSADERAALKKFVAGGGTVLVDSYAGLPEFARSARAELEKVFGELKGLPDDHILAAGRFEGGEDLTEGVRFKLLTNPKQFLGDEQNWVVGMECFEMELGEPDESGRRRPLVKPGSEFVIDTDVVIIALGTTPNPLIASTTRGLETTRRG
ncbi:hypothetical protein LCGC14_2336590, partial [marine sediment metagenome]